MTWAPPVAPEPVGARVLSAPLVAVGSDELPERRIGARTGVAVTPAEPAASAIRCRRSARIAVADVSVARRNRRRWRRFGAAGVAAPRGCARTRNSWCAFPRSWVTTPPGPFDILPDA